MSSGFSSIASTIHRGQLIMAIDRQPTPEKPRVTCSNRTSGYPEFARFLVKHGMDSPLLNPDAGVKTTMAILDTDQVLSMAADGSKRQRKNRMRES